MHRIWLVARHDFLVTIRQRSFWLLTLLMPVLLIGLNAYYAVQENRPDTAAEAESSDDLATLPALGLVDPAGLATSRPPDLPAELFIPYATESAAREDLAAGRLDQVVVIPADYLATGRVTVYGRDVQISGGRAQQGVGFGGFDQALAYLLAYNVAPDPTLIRALQDPTPISPDRQFDLAPAAPAEAGQRTMVSIVAAVMPYVYYMLLLLGGSYLMRSVVAEKENRTAEILLASLQPRDLLLGKILALSLVTLLQLLFWVAGGIYLVRRAIAAVNAPDFRFPPGFFVWAIAFLVLGFLLYAAVMAAAGAVAPTAREGGQVVWLLIVPLLPTLMFAETFVEEPDSAITLFLSLFPFSAPSAMVTRLVTGQVPLWQPLLSLLLLAVTAWALVLLAARYFRPDNLLSLSAFSWRRLFWGWRP